MGESIVTITKDVTIRCEGKCSKESGRPYIITRHRYSGMTPSVSRSKQPFLKIMFGCVDCGSQRVYGSMAYD